MHFPLLKTAVGIYCTVSVVMPASQAVKCIMELYCIEGGAMFFHAAHN